MNIIAKIILIRSGLKVVKINLIILKLIILCSILFDIEVQHVLSHGSHYKSSTDSGLLE